MDWNRVHLYQDPLEFSHDNRQLQSKFTKHSNPKTKRALQLELLQQTVQQHHEQQYHCKYHWDRHDETNCLCVLITLGSYKFHSHLLIHGNFKITEESTF